MSNAPGAEVRGGRVGVVAGAVVVAVRVGHVEEERPGHEVEEDGAPHVRGCAARADGDDVEDVVPPVTGDVDAEGAVARAVVDATVVAEFVSVFVAAT